jgi:nitroreductase
VRKPTGFQNKSNVQDYSAVIENILLAVTALGYASCWVEGQVTGDPSRQAEMARLLGAPPAYTLAACLPIGCPEAPGKRPAYKSFEERACFNRFTLTAPGN